MFADNIESISIVKENAIFNSIESIFLDIL